MVAPFTGAWIEICTLGGYCYGTSVAPFTGAWIEIVSVVWIFFSSAVSHPSRVRGLKSEQYYSSDQDHGVAPFTGAWIEISETPNHFFIIFSRTLHGCVD